MPIILGSVLVFAIDMVSVSAAEVTKKDCNFIQAESFVNLEDDEFWDKFRESVMKDKDKNQNKNPDHSNDGRRDEAPQNDISHSTRH